MTSSSSLTTFFREKYSNKQKSILASQKDKRKKWVLMMFHARNPFFSNHHFVSFKIIPDERERERDYVMMSDGDANDQQIIIHLLLNFSLSKIEKKKSGCDDYHLRLSGEWKMMLSIDIHFFFSRRSYVQKTRWHAFMISQKVEYHSEKYFLWLNDWLSPDPWCEKTNLDN